MILNIRISAVFLLFSIGLFAQKNDSIPVYQYSKNDPETVFIDLEAFYPTSFGDNVYNDAYNFDPGFALNVNWFIRPYFTVGAQLSQFTGHVENKSLTGNIDRTNFQFMGITVGYYYSFNRLWSLHSKIGIGVTNYRSSFPEDKFEDNGGQLQLTESVSYRIDKGLALFAKAGLEYHFNHIDILPAKDTYFNTAFFGTIGIGLRWHLQNPGG